MECDRRILRGEVLNVTSLCISVVREDLRLFYNYFAYGNPIGDQVTLVNNKYDLFMHFLLPYVF